MNALHEIKEDLKLTLADFGDLLEIVDLLDKNYINKAKDKIRDLDTYVRDYCVEYFNEDMLRQVDMEGNGSQGKFTGKRYAYKELAIMVKKGAALYLNQNLGSLKFNAKEFHNAQKTSDPR